jgi:hypothetical protein
VPETPIDKDRDPCGDKHDVGLARGFRVKPVPQAAPVEFLAEQHLTRCVLAAHAAHGLASLRVGSIVGHARLN